ncbi:hypothetical protein BDZ97DRAFT_1925380 [Flammula alnicola]|nr:hypothetical protein BDZ97DRAFT_1925380 [Flammula alnicola]
MTLPSTVVVYKFLVIGPIAIQICKFQAKSYIRNKSGMINIVGGPGNVDGRGIVERPCHVTSISPDSEGDSSLDVSRHAEMALENFLAQHGVPPLISQRGNPILTIVHTEILQSLRDAMRRVIFTNVPAKQMTPETVLRVFAQEEIVWTVLLRSGFRQPAKISS